MQKAGNGQEVDVKHKTVSPLFKYHHNVIFLGLCVIREEAVMQVGNSLCQYFPSPKCQHQLGNSSFSPRCHGHDIVNIRKFENTLRIVDLCC